MTRMRLGAFWAGVMLMQLMCVFGSLDLFPEKQDCVLVSWATAAGLTLAGYDLLGLLCCCCYHVIQRKKPKLSANAAPPPASAAAALEESPSAPPRETGWLVGGAASEPSAPLRSSGSPEQGWLMGSSLGALSTRRKSSSFRVGGESAAEADDERGPSMVRV